MMIGRVIDKVISTRKYDSMQGFKLLVVRPLYETEDRCIVVADEIGAGEGELVLVAKGSPAQSALSKLAPIDSVVVGIVDGELNL